jgi:hypothetical protein
MDWIHARRKAIVAAIAAVLVVFLDESTAKEIAAAAGAVLTYAVPNAD